MENAPHNPAEKGGHDGDYVPSPEEVAIGHERRDTSIRSVVVFAIIFTLSVAATMLIVVGVEAALRRWQAAEELRKPQPHPLSVDSALPKSIPPGPLLEPSPPNDRLPQEDLKLVREHAEKVLSSYGNLGNGMARIPLKSAMDVVVERGLPLTLPATQPGMGPTMPPASAQHGPGGVP